MRCLQLGLVPAQDGLGFSCGFLGSLREVPTCAEKGMISGWGSSFLHGIAVAKEVDAEPHGEWPLRAAWCAPFGANYRRDCRTCMEMQEKQNWLQLLLRGSCAAPILGRSFHSRAPNKV